MEIELQTDIMKETDLLSSQILNFLEKSKLELDTLITPLQNNELILKQSILQELDNDKNQEIESVKNQLIDKIEKSLQTIESLIKDKEQMQIKIEDQRQRLKDIQQQHQQELLDLQDQFKKQIKSQKEQWLVQERVKKEKWEQEMRTQIKNGTVQQLQFSIQNILDKNKEELRDMQDQCQIEVKQQKEIIVQEYEKKIEQLRIKYLEEKETSLFLLRQKTQQQLQEQFEQFQVQFEEERKRMRESQVLSLVRSQTQDTEEVQNLVLELKKQHNQEKQVLLSKFQTKENGLQQEIQKLQQKLSNFQDALGSQESIKYQKILQYGFTIFKDKTT
eukprot:403377260